MSEKRFVWDGLEIAEERDGSNALTKRFHEQGVMVGSDEFYYTRDHLGSIRELTSDTGAIEARYDYDPYGRVAKAMGSGDADFRFTGHYFHATSGLHLATFRAYDADIGRWLSRDPIAEQGPDGPNIYSYVSNNPANGIDPMGLWQFTIYGGSGLGGYFTFGRNSGQWNIGIRVGGGAGLSASLDTSDSGCQGTGLSGAFPVFAAGAGAGVVGASAEAGVNHGNLGGGSTNPYGSIGGNFGPFAVTASGGIGINSPMRGFYGGVSKGLQGGIVGASAFAGVGGSFTW
jgi:RHS repeat-associated protein